ncbi:MAG: hypothetical protein QM760_11670 [Nibricoccus sp.]
MSEWWLIIAFFWLWLFADGLKFWSLPRFLVSAAFGRRARVGHGNVLLSVPTPLTWHAVTDDPPYSLSPDGLCNLPAGSAGRPSPEPDLVRAWRWEEIREVKQKRRRILINGTDFCAVTVFGNARNIRDLVARMTPLPASARASLAAGHIARWFRPTHLKRRQTVLLARTRTIAELGFINFCLALLISTYLLTHAQEWIGAVWAERLIRALPLIGIYVGCIQLAMLFAAWRAHRRLLPTKAEQRVSLLLNALLLPPLALKLRAQIANAYFPAQHPLSWLVAAGRPAGTRHFAREIITDLRWPLPPLRQLQPELVASVSAWTSQQVTRHVERLLKGAGIAISDLLAAPAPDGSTSCAYCPRCRDQFTTPDARCPRGIKLLALK